MQLRYVVGSFSFVLMVWGVLALPACLGGYPGGQLGAHAGNGGTPGTAGSTGSTAGAGGAAGAGTAGSSGDPCRNVVCNMPPPGGCANDDTYVVSMGAGECNRLNGTCAYPRIDIPCVSCLAVCADACTGVDCPDKAGGCLTGGFCDPISAACVYEEAPNGDRCDRAGVNDGVCVNGVCDVFIACSGDDDCNDDNPCTQDSCVADACVFAPVTPGSESCDDGDPCTYDDVCAEGGTCAGIAITCASDTAACGAVRGCNGTSTCTEVYPGPAKGCDDGNPCTYGDVCNGSGACVGTAISCPSSGGTCGVKRSCNGTAFCSEYTPDSSTDCGTCGHCNGFGACVGQCSGSQQCCEGTFCAAQCP